MPEISIVIPVYNEEECLPLLIQEITGQMQQCGVSYEVIFVNDGSTDNSLKILEENTQHFPDIVKIVNLNERKGQTHALREGFKAIKGNIAVTLDADLQNDPADIPKLLEGINDGYDCMCGWRKARHDKPLKACFSKLGNVIQRMFTGMTIHDISCTLRAYKKHCIDKVPLDWEGQHRFIPLGLSQQGFKIGEIISNHRDRKFGTTKYKTRRIVKVAKDFFRVINTKYE